MANLPVAFFSSIATIPTALPLVSEKAKGAGYYGSADSMHTVQFSTVNHFVGAMKLQGTLVHEPTDADWFDIPETVIDQGITPLTAGAVIRNFTGNFVWVRAVIDRYTAGSVNRVLYTHN